MAEELVEYGEKMGEIVEEVENFRNSYPLDEVAGNSVYPKTLHGFLDGTRRMLDSAQVLVENDEEPLEEQEGDILRFIQARLDQERNWYLNRTISEDVIPGKTAPENLDDPYWDFMDESPAYIETALEATSEAVTQVRESAHGAEVQETWEMNREENDMDLTMKMAQSNTPDDVDVSLSTLIDEFTA